VGTGSLLVAAAYFGAFTYGSDIDVRVLHGHGVGQLNKNSKMKLPENPVKPYMFYNFI
jgi:tRNA G10  N-methylase Trm11